MGGYQCPPEFGEELRLHRLAFCLDGTLFSGGLDSIKKESEERADRGVRDRCCPELYEVTKVVDEGAQPLKLLSAKTASHRRRARDARVIDYYMDQPFHLLIKCSCPTHLSLQSLALAAGTVLRRHGRILSTRLVSTVLDP